MTTAGSGPWRHAESSLFVHEDDRFLPSLSRVLSYNYMVTEIVVHPINELRLMMVENEGNQRAAARPLASLIAEKTGWAFALMADTPLKATTAIHLDGVRCAIDANWRLFDRPFLRFRLHLSRQFEGFCRQLFKRLVDDPLNKSELTNDLIIMVREYFMEDTLMFTIKDGFPFDAKENESLNQGLCDYDEIGTTPTTFVRLSSPPLEFRDAALATSQISAIPNDSPSKPNSVHPSAKHPSDQSSKKVSPTPSVKHTVSMKPKSEQVGLCSSSDSSPLSLISDM